MRYLFFLFFTALLLSCHREYEQKPEFLIGKWQRLGEKEGKQTYEYWDAGFEGLGFTLQNKDTVFKEILTIKKVQDTLRLLVEGVNEHPTPFTFIHQTDTSFTCRNLKNEFPTHITYWKSGSALKAKVQNQQFSIDFTFQKIKD